MDAPPSPPNPLIDLHRGAEYGETADYGGVEVVTTFGEPQAEYAAIRKGAGLIDSPQRGALELTGKDRHAFLGNLVTQQVYYKETKSGLPAGRAAYSFLLNLKGRVVADMDVVEVPGDRTFVACDFRSVPVLAEVFDRYLFGEQVTVTGRAGDLHALALHGPGAGAVLADVLDAPLAPASLSQPLEPGGSAVGRFAGAEVVAWRDDPCGVPGYHLLLPASAAIDLWETVSTRYAAGELGKRNVRPVGWAAFNACRVEAGRPLFGIDFEPAPPSLPGKKPPADEASPTGRTPGPTPGLLPAETGLFDRAVSVVKGCYLGQEVVARMHARQVVARKIVGLRVDGDRLPVAGAELLDDAGNQVGVVTSSTVSPVLSGAAIGLALVKKSHMAEGSTFRVAAEGGVHTARVVPTPFLGPSL